MSKVVVVGITESGKTCYFYGMLRLMMRGYQGFSIRVQDKDYSHLRSEMKRLGDTSLSLDERLPSSSIKTEKYSLDLLYNFKKLDTVEWIDYPGEDAERCNEDFMDLLNGANSLLLCVDGSKMVGTEADIEDIADSFFNDSGGMDLCNALMQAEKKSENGLPPVCIVITKLDAVSEELRSTKVFVEILRKSFPILFSEGNGGKMRLVTICPVTLGTELMSGGKLAPRHVEKPICFSSYLIQLAVYQELQEQVQQYMKIDAMKAEAATKKGTWKKMVDKIIKPKPESQPMSEEQKSAMFELLNMGKDDLNVLRSVIENMPLFINGKESTWSD